MKDKPVLNQVPKESAIRKKIKPLGANETATYRLFGSYDPVKKKYSLRDVCVPNLDVITDPETGDTYEIGYVVNQDTNGKINLGEIWFEKTALCRFTLHGNNVKEKKIYDFLEMSNYLVSNPNRDPSAPALVERVDNDTDSKKLRDIRKEKIEAFKVVEAMSEAELTQFIKGENLPMPKTLDAKKDLVEELIEKGGAKNLLNSSIGGSASQDLVQLIESAKKKEKIAWDKANSVWSLPDGSIALKVKNKATNVAELVKFLASEKGAETLELIK